MATLKPTRGRIASIAAAGSPDPLDLWTQFAVARDVRDLIALFDHVATGVTNQGASSDVPLRVGFVTSDPIIGLDVDESCAAAVAAVAGELADAGHIVEDSFPAPFATLFEPFWTSMSTIGPWVRAGQVEWVSQRLGRPCQAGDLSDDVLALAERGASLSNEAIDEALERVAAAMAPVATWWDEGHDVLVSPVTLQPAWTLGEDAPMRTGMFAAPFSFTGQPAAVIPGGWTDDGRPVGVQLVGRSGSDELLLELALELQHRLGWLDRHPPTCRSRLQCQDRGSRGSRRSETRVPLHAGHQLSNRHDAHHKVPHNVRTTLARHRGPCAGRRHSIRLRVITVL